MGKGRVEPHRARNQVSGHVDIGERGFEPPTPWSRTRCSTRLSHSPTVLEGDERKTAPGAEISGLRLLRNYNKVAGSWRLPASFPILGFTSKHSTKSDTSNILSP